MSRVRYREDVGWEMRCEACVLRHIAAWWPLTTEFWTKRSTSRCRACINDRQNRVRRERRGLRSAAERAESMRVYKRKWMRDWRARHKAAA